MAEPHEGPDGLEGLAFQLILQKLLSLERAMQGIPPLLAKIVNHLEAQTQHPEVPIATYAQLYPELQEEREEQGTEEQKTTETVEPVPTVPHKRRLWQWFVKEE
jgi:hypothetical protein